MVIRVPKATREDKIRFLIWNDIPLSKYVTSPQGEPNEPKDQIEEGVLQEVADYRKKLLEMGEAELDRLYQQKKAEEQLRMSEEREAKRFFHQPSAKADFAHWSKCAHWTIDEAVALTLGKEPEVVTWAKVHAESEFSPFVKKFSRIRDLAQRAVQWKQIFPQTLPGIYLAWAKQTGVDLPEELVAAVEARGTQIANWKDMYGELFTKYEQQQKEYLQALEQQNELIEMVNQFGAEKAEKKDEIDSLVKERDEWLDEKESLSEVRKELEAIQLKQEKDDPLSASGYWCSFRDKVETAVAEYPDWRKTQRAKISKESDLTPWVRERFDPVERETAVIKKVLSDIFPELQ